MRTHKLLMAAAVALLFVGAGCLAKEQAEVEVGAPEVEGAMEAKIEAEAEVGPVDAAVEATLEGMMEEQDAEKEAEQDASQVEADEAEINAYGEGSYEVK